MDKVLGKLAASAPGSHGAAAAAGTGATNPSPGGLHCRARPVRRLQHLDRAARARARQRADAPRARRSSSSASAARATISCAGITPSQIIEHDRSARRRERSASSTPQPIAEKVIALLRGRRVRRLHVVLLALPLGDRADPDRAAAHSAGVRRRSDRRAWAARSTSTSRTKRRFSHELLPRNVAVQMFRALLENAASFTARKCARWTTRRAMPAT